MDYTFFDVETPNRFNDRMCSIGLVRTDECGNVLLRENHLINPEQAFDTRNSEIHGLHYSDVRDAPAFAEAWSSYLMDAFADSTLVAHNASFDMAVLTKCLLAYGLPLPPVLHLCTETLAKNLAVPTQNYKLPTLCEYYGIELSQHHDAMADAQACEGIFWAMVNHEGIAAPNGIPYVWNTSVRTTHFADSTNQAMVDLYGIILGIELDEVLNRAEMRALSDWQKRNSKSRGAPYFTEAFGVIESLLGNGVFTSRECDALKNITAPFVQNPSGCPQTVALQQLMGLIRGIMADGRINTLEALNLRLWLEESADLHISQFETIAANIDKVLADGSVSENEEKMLFTLFEGILNPVDSGGADVCCGIAMEGSSFCLSGDFLHGKKSDIARLIEERGGVIADNVSGKVAFVVVGGEGSARYAFGNYGTKVKKAMELQEKGKPIRIITEDDLFSSL